MAERPVFVPNTTGTLLVEEIAIQFNWHPGLAAAQKKRNVLELHQAAASRGLSPLLEISSKSEVRAGKNLSAFHLKLEFLGNLVTVESAYQGSKVFEQGGPFTDLYWLESRDAKRDERLRQSGKLIGFRFGDEEYPISPVTVFYDWLYFKALYPHRNWIRKREEWMGFTDIEFNPERSLNCQARSFATFISLQRRGKLDQAVVSFEKFREVIQSSAI